LTRQDLLLLTIAAVGLILALPPFPTGFLAFFMLVPFFFFLKKKRGGRAIIGSYFLGVLWAAGTVYWVGWATVGGVIGIILIMPIYLCLFTLIWLWLFKGWGQFAFIAAPFIWVGMEFFQSTTSLAFPWNALAHTQTYTPEWIQFASLTGRYSVSFWIVTINVLVYFVISLWKKGRLRWKLLIILLILITVPFLHGKIRMKKPLPKTETIRVSLIQGNIDPFAHFTPTFIDSNIGVYRSLSKRVLSDQPDLLVWPETATACYIRHPSHLYHFQQVRALVDSLSIPLLTGSPDFEFINNNKVNKMNSALLILADTDSIQRYSKIYLVPFSEQVPYKEEFPPFYQLARKLDLDIGDFTPGDSLTNFQMNLPNGKRITFGVLICYESVFSRPALQLAKKGAQFLIVITNDGWFGRTSGPYQHSQIAVLRAIENRLWIARCANTGISALIDPYGRILKRTQLSKPDMLTVDLPLLRSETFFSKSYLIFYYAILIGLLLIILATLVINNSMFSHRHGKE
jgi:apolipoprotein N-acyltransferase